MRIHILQHVAFEGAGYIADWALSRGHSLVATRLDEGAALPALADFDWLVVMGGPMSVHDESRYPWMSAEKRLIREAIGAGRIMLGICLGAQFVAEALGAEVTVGRHKEIGWWPVTWSPDASRLFGAALPPRSDVFHWHGETFDLPAGAIRLASSQPCANQAFQFGDRIVGLQFHLEVTRPGVEALVSACRDEVVPGPYVQAAEDLVAANGHFATCHGLLDGLLDALSSVPARPARPAVHGVNLDAQSRCVHFHGPTDIVAIKFKCCDVYYACNDCHAALSGHVPAVWPRTQWDHRAVLCGQCGHELTVDAYLRAASRCPECDAAFNPRCALHHHLYFETAGH